jgi:hypothetical protein
VDPTRLAAASAVVALGATIQGSVGFGLNLVTAPLLALIDPNLVPGPTLLAGLVLTVLLAGRDRAGIDVRGVGWALVGRVPGTLVGAGLVAAIPPSEISLVIGVAVLAGVAMTAAGLRLRPTVGVLVGAGLLSGLMGTAAAIGAPPVALVYQHATGVRLRGTLAGYFVPGATLSLLALAAVGRFGPAEMRTGLALVPGILVGLVLSRHTAPILDRGYTRPAVLTVSVAAALVLVVGRLAFP